MAMLQKKVKTTHGCLKKKRSPAGRLIMAAILIELGLAPSSPFSLVDRPEVLAADTSASTSSHQHKLIRPQTSSAFSSESTNGRRWHRWKGNRDFYQATGSSSSTSSTGSTSTGSGRTGQGSTTPDPGTVNTPQTVPVTPPADAPAASSATLMWNPVTVSDLAGYKVYRSTTSGVYSAPIATVSATSATATNHVSTGLQTGNTYYWRITAYDTSGAESEPSVEVSKSVY